MEQVYLKTQLKLYQTRINQFLDECLKQQAEKKGAIASFNDAMKYCTLNQGKRLRPALAYSVADALGIELTKTDVPAAALELIHCYSLVHDDLPAMDDDDLRRGQATAHIKYSEAHAILIGDAQQSLAFEIVSNADILTAEQRLEMINILSIAAGANGMIAGQVLDIEAENKSIPINHLKQLHMQKTGALIQVALLSGAITSENYANLKPLLLELGEKIGLAFQVHDDVLDIESDSHTLGKPQGSDLAANKSTYPKLLGLQQAKDYRDELLKEAKQVLQKSELQSPFLHDLIDYIGSRKY